ncbi:unnamed protein product [Brassicogethes aeneus]|uniref:Large ribosomal subunit protein uL30m n=1 Tax=Brassicogethes aeneus TaxID=1431903 RepID=A0A9P0AYJ5_BRAAE|nr:unnamed protein product [Brassicogethes aeneus]
MSGLLKIFSPSVLFKRNLGKRYYKWHDEGIQYPCFKYYPRHPEFKDPPYEPTKLFRVERIKPLKGLPYWEKNILKEFKLDGKKNSYNVIKNIPENNGRLWKIKHLIKITPITFPNGFPTDTNGTYLKENGELEVVQKLQFQEEKLKITDQFINDKKKLDGDTLRRNSRLKWLTGWEC